MPSPSHVTVTVISARNLLVKGKNGKNDAFVTIHLGDKKYQTSVKQRSVTPVWNEQCEFLLPNQYCTLTLSAQHRSLLGFDEFLGQLRLPIDEIYEPGEQPRDRWYPLKGKSGKKDEHKYRGELELRLEFDAPKPGVGGEQLEAPKALDVKRGKRLGSLPNLTLGQKTCPPFSSSADLQQVSEEKSEVPAPTEPTKTEPAKTAEEDDVEATIPPRIIGSSRNLSYEVMPRRQLIDLIAEQRRTLARQERRIRELEEYIDHLLVRVMESQPSVLQVPVVSRGKLRF